MKSGGSCIKKIWARKLLMLVAILLRLHDFSMTTPSISWTSTCHMNLSSNSWVQLLTAIRHSMTHHTDINITYPCNVWHNGGAFTAERMDNSLTPV